MVQSSSIFPFFSYYFSKVGHHFQSSSDDDDDFKPMSFLHTEHSLQQVGMLMTVTQLVLKTVCNQKFDILNNEQFLKEAIRMSHTGNTVHCIN